MTYAEFKALLSEDFQMPLPPNWARDKDKEDTKEIQYLMSFMKRLIVYSDIDNFKDLLLYQPDESLKGLYYLTITLILEKNLKIKKSSKQLKKLINHPLFPNSFNRNISVVQDRKIDFHFWLSRQIREDTKNYYCLYFQFQKTLSEQCFNEIDFYKKAENKEHVYQLLSNAKHVNIIDVIRRLKR